MPKRLWESIQIACAYVGTIVGAGFASGQELHQFFGRHDALAYPAAVLATCLYAWMGYRVMLLGHRLKATSYLDVTRHLFGPRLRVVVNVSLNVMMFGIVVAMLAGAGTLFQERAGVPFSLGALFTGAITFLTLLYGLKGLLRINVFIVPTMFTFLSIACLRILFANPGGVRQGMHLAVLGHPMSVLGAIMSAFVYVCFNVGLAAGVLIPLGAAAKDVGTLKFGATFGALTLGIMMMAVLLTLSLVPGALTKGIPMAYVAGLFGGWFAKGFMVVLFGEIFSTLVGDLFSIVTQIPDRLKRYRSTITGLLLAIAFLFSHIGFSSIVEYGYSTFGWLSTAFLIALLWPRSL